MKKILYFSAPWCGPCKTLGPIMESLSGQINYQKINVDTNQDLPIEHGIRNIPALILLEDGKVKNKQVGLLTKDQILDFYNG